jgi:YVTN family beta-propeller protein
MKKMMERESIKKTALVLFAWAALCVLSSEAYASFGIAVTQDGKRVYVVNEGDNSVSVIDADSASATYHQTVDKISVGDGPFDIVLSDDDQYAYVSDASDDTISVIETASGTLFHTLSLGSCDKPGGLAIETVGLDQYEKTYLYAACRGNQNIAVVDLSVSPPSFNRVDSMGVDVFDLEGDTGGAAPGETYIYHTKPRETANSSLRAMDIHANGHISNDTAIDVQQGARIVAVKPGTRKCYVSNYGSDSVSTMDMSSSGNSVTNISLGLGAKKPFGLAISRDGERVYVANSGDGTVSVIDASADSSPGNTYNQVIQTIQVGGSPWAIAAHNPVYVRDASADGDTVSVINTTTGAVEAAIEALKVAAPSEASSAGEGGGGGGCFIETVYSQQIMDFLKGLFQ